MNRVAQLSGDGFDAWLPPPRSDGWEGPLRHLWFEKTPRLTGAVRLDEEASAGGHQELALVTNTFVFLNNYAD